MLLLHAIKLSLSIPMRLSLRAELPLSAPMRLFLRVQLALKSLTVLREIRKLLPLLRKLACHTLFLLGQALRVGGRLVSLAFGVRGGLLFEFVEGRRLIGGDLSSFVQLGKRLQMSRLADAPR
jgi:hypothetical protein